MARHAWQESFDLFRAVDDARALSPQDLSAMLKGIPNKISIAEVSWV
jgi:hypothetical protein